MVRSTTLSLLFVLAVLTAACEGGADVDEQETEVPTDVITEQADAGANDEEAVARLTDAAEATRAAGTARFVMTVVGGGDQPAQKVAEGEEDFAEQRRSITFTGAQGNLEAVVDGTETYVATPILEDAQWVRMDLSELGAAGGLGGPVGLPLQDPGGALDLLGGSSDVQEIGEETIGDVDTTQYAVTVDVTEAAQQADAATGSNARTALAQAGVEDLSMNVWIDEDDLIRRVAYTLETEPTELSAGDQSVEAGGPATATFDYSEFGEPVDITVPSGSGVLDIDEEAVRDQIRSLTGGSVGGN